VSSTLITVVLAVVSSGLLTAVANNVWQRRRIKADTASVLNETALELVVPLREQIKEMRGEINTYRERIGMLERREREIITAMSRHAAWDMVAQAAILANKLEIHEMPPLFPQSMEGRAERTRSTDYQTGEIPRPVTGGR
jgi:hypothetical protein